MTTRWSRVCGALGVALLVWPAAVLTGPERHPSAQPVQNPPQQQRPPVFRGGTAVVEVDFYPTRDGRIVEGLTAADIEVLEDGVPQTIDELQFIRIEPFTPDSEVRDPNNTREMLQRAADPQNRVFILYLDRYHVRIEGAHAMRSALVDMLQRILAPNDLFAAMTTGMPANRLTLGRKTENIEEQLTRHWWSWAERGSLDRDEAEDLLAACFEYDGANRERWGADQAVERPLIEILKARRREDLVLTHLEDVISYLGGIREARKSVVVFTEGWILYGRDEAALNRLLGSFGSGGRPTAGVSGGRLTLGDPRQGASSTDCVSEAARLFRLDNAQRFRDIMRLANQRNVTFYPVNPSGIQVMDSTLGERMRVINPNEFMTQELGRVRERRDSMETLAENTDGVAIITNDLSAGLRRIVDDVSAYYVLTYASTNAGNDGRYRRIEVKIKQPDIRVRARRGYFAPEEGSARVVGAGTPAIASEVEAAFATLSRLRLDAPLFSYSTTAGQAALVVVELTSAQAARNTSGVPVVVRLQKADGTAVGTGEATIAPATRGALVRVPLGLDLEGPWRANITVGEGRDRLQDSLEVAESGGALIGEPVVYRATPSPRSPLIPVADFQFRRTERVHVEWPRLAETDQREARLLGRTGQPLAVPVTLTERDVDGRVNLAADLNLAPLTDGEYAIELVVGRGAESERRVVAIRVTR